MTIEVPAEVLPSRKRRLTILYLLATGGVLWLLFTYLGLSPSSFVIDFRFIADLAHEMLPPNISLFWTKWSIVASLIDTLSMANRSVPHLIVILVLLITVGIGPFAGMLALVFGAVGMYSKLFADAIEQADHCTLESVQSVGSTRLQTIRYAVLPQVMPSFVANLFYAFDRNLRAAIPLGVFGGGGIGFELESANGLLHYKDVLAYTILIVVMINGMERPRGLGVPGHHHLTNSSFQSDGMKRKETEQSHDGNDSDQCAHCAPR
jgi:phosphonate transport system permease protein